MRIVKAEAVYIAFNIYFTPTIISSVLILERQMHIIIKYKL